MEVLKNFDNKLFDRKEVVVSIENDGATLSREDAKKQIAKKLKVEEKFVVVRKINTKFGDRVVLVEANIYEDEAIMKRLTPQYLLKRNETEQTAEEA